jgi:hypothetical protein
MAGGDKYSIKTEGGGKLLARLDGMAKQLDRELPQKLFDEFWVWQTQDMNRNKPHIIFEGRKRMVTHFWNLPWAARRQFARLREGS